MCKNLCPIDTVFSSRLDSKLLQELGESGEAQPSDPFVEATVGEAVVRIRISEEESKTVAQLAATFERPSNVPKGKADVTSAMSKTPMQARLSSTRFRSKSFKPKLL